MLHALISALELKMLQGSLPLARKARNPFSEEQSQRQVLTLARPPPAWSPDSSCLAAASLLCS